MPLRLAPLGLGDVFACHLKRAQIQGLFTGHTPVVGLLANRVVLHSGLVEHWQPLDGVCGQRLRGQDEELELEAAEVTGLRSPAAQTGLLAGAVRVWLTFKKMTASVPWPSMEKSCRSPWKYLA